jgi:hypothetical protein
MGQLMLSDGLVHSGRIWDHVVGWSQGYMLTDIVGSRSVEMREHFTAWKRVGPLTNLRTPPA